MLWVRLIVTGLLLVGVYSETGFWTALAFGLLTIALEGLANIVKQLEAITKYLSTRTE